VSVEFPPLLSVKDALAALSGTIAKSTLYAAIDRGEIRSCRIGGRILVHADSLRQLIDGPAPAVEPKPAPAPKRPASRKKRRGRPALDLW
jgi:excisionase family DNA binding protein